MAKLDINNIDYVLDKLHIPNVNKGDVIRIGNQILYCNDCMSQDLVDSLPNNFEILFTSPPYLDRFNYYGTIDANSKYHKTICLYHKKCNYLLYNLGIMYRNGEIFEYWNEYISTARSVELKLMSWLVWDKYGPGSISGINNLLVPISHEFIFVFGKNKKELNTIILKRHYKSQLKRTHTTVRNHDGSVRKIRRNKTNNMYRKTFSVIDIPNEKINNDYIINIHPARFPVELPELIFKSFLNKNDIAIDIFCGSGSSLIASERAGFVCYGIELSELFCRIIIYRFVKEFSIDHVIINNVKYNLNVAKIKEFYKTKCNIDVIDSLQTLF